MARQLRTRNTLFTPTPCLPKSPISATRISTPWWIGMDRGERSRTGLCPVG